uniref:Amyloid beta protein binding family B member 2 n=1 Tax=Gasterosteus aculeatus aculeatus TaxID=481459 RepID=A0AAQ4QTR7_GASAC
LLTVGLVLPVVMVTCGLLPWQQSVQKDTDLPPGWKKNTDMGGVYYWHIPTGPTQWEKPAASAGPPGACFAVRSLGWVEMAEDDLAPGKSSVAVNNCIRQLSYCKNDIRDTVGIWGEGKDMYLVLENNMLNLVDPMDRGLLHSQPIASIRVWGVGRDNGRSVSQWQPPFFYRFPPLLPAPMMDQLSSYPEALASTSPVCPRRSGRISALCLFSSTSMISHLFKMEPMARRSAEMKRSA